ncbi:sigma-70 family RNA polymerase sigma factor [Undibacterium sp. Ji67W]|uniref:sigma-70 family RNA polymerase sigma factor n=1 Tax=Undibacterium sp. Ji67W TaxID=3413042 RepID=UPI003BF01FC6
MEDKARTGELERSLLAQLDSAYNLARWLTRDDHDAEDLVQNAYVRAFRFRDGFRGDDARNWILTIVRHTFYTQLRNNKQQAGELEFDENLLPEAGLHESESSYAIGNDPAQILETQNTSININIALDTLPTAFREILVMKEMDDLSYKDIAQIADIPLGTVMSRLARARKMLLDLLTQRGMGEKNGL